jgi:3-oxoadipate enol-lactonase
MEVMNVQGTDISINANGITMCFDDFGKGQTPIIFIHGFPFDKSSWAPQMAFMRKTQRVIAYDIRGFGATTLGTAKPSMRTYADDLVKFMDNMGIPKAIVCGLSMGGYILFNAVQRYPERFKALILCDTQTIADTEEAKKKRQQTIELIKTDGLATFTEGVVKNVFCAESRIHKTEAIAKTKDIILSTPKETIIAGLTALAERPDMTASLKGIKIPTLIICGKEDSMTPTNQAEALHIAIKNSVLQIIEKAGHLSSLEQPDVFNRHLAGFVATLTENSRQL